MVRAAIDKRKAALASGDEAAAIQAFKELQKAVEEDLPWAERLLAYRKKMRAEAGLE